MPSTDNDHSADTENITQPVHIYTGPRWLADLKVRFGQ